MGLQLHPLCQQKPIVAYCHEHGIVVQAYTPLIRGKFDHPVFARLAEKVCGCRLGVAWSTDNDVTYNDYDGLRTAQARPGTNLTALVAAEGVSPVCKRTLSWGLLI